MKKYRKLLIIVLIISFVVTGSGLYGRAEEEDYSSLQIFQEVLLLIKNYHVEDISLDILVEGAIEGMVEKLDAHSSYLTPEEYEEMQVEFEGHFGGIGIVITTRDEKLTIVSPIKGTPGDKAGLQSGDIIMAVDGVPTAEMTQDEAVRMMRGEEGTEVELTISREGLEEPVLVKIIRADIEITYVEAEMKKNNIGYITISHFASDVGVKVAEELKKLTEQGAEGIILDLRSNPGGLLNEAVNVASNFLDEGSAVVSVKQRDNNETVLKVEPEIDAVNLPLIVMINGGSASASEIVAGAVKDHQRGKLLGTKSFGKGTVQTLIPLEGGSALRLTTARYFTPAGNFIHEKGIEPDVEVKYDPEYTGDNQLDRAISHLNSLIIAEQSVQQMEQAAGE